MECFTWLARFSTEDDAVLVEVGEDCSWLSAHRIVEMLEKQRLDAIRTKPLLLDQNGRAYWKLRSHSDGSHILLQDIGNQDLVTPQDKWFIHDDEQEKAVQNYISTTRQCDLSSNPSFVEHREVAQEKGLSLSQWGVMAQI